MSNAAFLGGTSSGWWSLRASYWRASRLSIGGGLASGVAVFATAAKAPLGGVGYSPSVVFS